MEDSQAADAGGRTERVMERQFEVPLENVMEPIESHRNRVESAVMRILL